MPRLCGTASHIPSAVHRSREAPGEMAGAAQTARPPFPPRSACPADRGVGRRRNGRSPRWSVVLCVAWSGRTGCRGASGSTGRVCTGVTSPPRRTDWSSSSTAGSVTRVCTASATCQRDNRALLHGELALRFGFAVAGRPCLVALQWRRRCAHSAGQGSRSIVTP